MFCSCRRSGFPHSTDTMFDVDTVGESSDADASTHLTFNFDTHVWNLDYLSVRRLALRRAGVADSALGHEGRTINGILGMQIWCR